MKKCIILFVAIVSASSCGKTGNGIEEDIIEQEKQEVDFTLSGEVPTVEDLQGTWIIIEDFVTKRLTFEKDTFVLTHVEYDVPRSRSYTEYGTYSYSEGALTWAVTKTEYDSIGRTEEYSGVFLHTRTSKVSTLFNKTVLLVEVSKEYARYKYDNTLIYYKENTCPATDLESIQGKWVFSKDDKTYASFEFKENSYDFQILTWKERYTGTFSLENGYLNIKDYNYYYGLLEYDGTISWHTPEPGISYSYTYKSLKSFTLPFVLAKKKVALIRHVYLSGEYIKQEAL